MNRKNVLASMLFAGLGLAVISSAAGCGGTQYGGKPSSIPRDVDSDDANSNAQPQSTPPSNTGSPGTGTGSTGGTGTRR